MDLKNILIENSSGKLIIQINTPEKMNCLDLQTLSELENVIHYINNNENIYGAIIIGSGDKAFISGADIQEFKKVDVNNALEFSLNGQRVFSLIENSKKPIIAAVNGYALGGGCELAMACHLRILSENAVIGLPEVKLGIIPGYGGTYRLANLIGKGRALEYMLSGKFMSAEDALRFGFANHVINLADLLTYSLKILDTILTNSPVSIEMILKSVNSYEQANLEMIEAENFKSCFERNDVTIGVDAFLKKKKPNFLKK